MDKRTVLGIVLIVIVTLLMPYYLKWIAGEQPPSEARKDTSSTQLKDTAKVDTQQAGEIEEKSPTGLQAATPRDTSKEVPRLPDIQSAPTEKVIYLESSLVKATLSSKQGGNLRKWELKKYDHYLGHNVDLIHENNGLNIELTNRDGKQLNLSDYNFYVDEPENSKITLDENNPTAEVVFYLPVKNGRIEKRYIFSYDSYTAEVILTLKSVQDYIVNRRYFLNWENGLLATEEDKEEDYSYARAYAYMAGELESFDVSEEGQESDPPYSGRVDWTAIRTKYFLVSIIPNSPDDMLSVSLSGRGMKQNDNLIKLYSTSLELPYSQSMSQTDSFNVYLGPLDHDILAARDVNLETLVMNRSWYEGLFRPLSIYIILPAFKFMHKFIPNYGLVIILFSILVKILLHPLTKKSYQSMGEMQYVQPELARIREQYKSDPQRLNKEMMKLYKERGINPLGGCIPMLLQMPLLVALFTVFRSTIQLRGEPFILWIQDLSLPDTLSLGFSLPLFGDSIHILPFFMGATMIWQSKMTMTDPKQKMMMYFMPVFLIFIFYSFPSGLNLYYAVFNLLSMVQTRLIKKKMHPDSDGKAKELEKPAQKTGTTKKPAPQKVTAKTSKSSKSKKKKRQR